MSRDQKRQKTQKDLYFLRSLVAKPLLGYDLIKYLQKEGIRDRISSIVIPFKITFSWVQYDFEGFIMCRRGHMSAKRNSGEKTRFNQIVNLIVNEGLPTMRLQETAWFRIRNDDLPESHGYKHPGCYFEVIVEKFTFQNGESFESKSKLFQQNSSQGKHLFGKQKYDEAIKMYSLSINTTAGFAKNNVFTPEQLNTLKEMNLKAKTNFLRCFNRLDKPDFRLQELGMLYSTELVRLKENDVLSYYLKGAFLLKARYLGDSLIFAQKAFEMDNSELSQTLLRDVKREIDLKREAEKT